MTGINEKEAEKARKMLKVLNQKAIPKVTVQAINKTLTGFRTDGVRAVGKDINLKAKIIREAFDLRKASRAKPTGEAIIHGKEIPLILFGAKQTAKGVLVKVKKTGQKYLHEHYFIAKRKSGKHCAFADLI